MMRDSMQTVTGSVRARWDAARINSLDRRNVRLRDEVSHLKIRLEDERSETDDLKDALRSSPKVVTVRRRSGIVRVAVIGAAAYVLGTRAGRQRYDQMAGWVRSMRSKLERKTDEMMASQMSAGMTAPTGPTPRPAARASFRTTEQPSNAIGRTGP
jgi:hypothetical protein